MPVSLDDLLKQALALPEQSRLLLAEELVASVNASAGLEDATVNRRRAEFLAGTAIFIPVEEALQQVRDELAA